MGWGSGHVPVPEVGVHSPRARPQLTYVDFLAYDLLDVLRLFEPTCLDAFPNLKDFIARFEVSPPILLLSVSFVSVISLRLLLSGSSEELNQLSRRICLMPGPVLGAMLAPGEMSSLSLSYREPLSRPF